MIKVYDLTHQEKLSIVISSAPELWPSAPKAGMVIPPRPFSELPTIRQTAIGHGAPFAPKLTVVQGENFLDRTMGTAKSWFRAGADLVSVGHGRHRQPRLNVHPIGASVLAGILLLLALVVGVGSASAATRAPSAPCLKNYAMPINDGVTLVTTSWSYCARVTGWTYKASKVTTVRNILTWADMTTETHSNKTGVTHTTHVLCTPKCVITKS